MLNSCIWYVNDKFLYCYVASLILLSILLFYEDFHVHSIVLNLIYLLYGLTGNQLMMTLITHCIPISIAGDICMMILWTVQMLKQKSATIFRGLTTHSRSHMKIEYAFQILDANHIFEYCR